MLEETPFDGRDDPAQRLDALEIVIGLPLHAVGERFDGIRAAQRVHGVDHAALVGDDLLGAQRDGDGMLAGEGQCLVQAVGVQGLGAAENRRQRLDRHPHDVDLGLLRGK